jgi:thioredoxin 1
MVKVITEVSDIPAKGHVIIDFFANWCGPCKRIAPVFSELSEKVPEITFLKVDVDESEELAQQFSVSALPTFVVISNGKVVKRIEGADLNGIVEIIQTLTNK